MPQIAAPIKAKAFGVGGGFEFLLLAHSPPTDFKDSD
jgi:hypothetical protein